MLKWAYAPLRCKFEVHILHAPVFPFKVVCCKIDPELEKIGSTDFVKMCKKDNFLLNWAHF